MLPRRALLFLAAALAGCPAHAGDDLLDRYRSVEILPGKASIFIGTVTLTMPPFVRKDGVFSSTYAAAVFPYFFFDESGTIRIDIPDEALRRVAGGQKIAFVGRGTSDSGEDRRVEGSAEPVDAMSGAIKVRIFVSKRISLVFNTTYRLTTQVRPSGSR
jgi:hypothetical protein